MKNQSNILILAVFFLILSSGCTKSLNDSKIVIIENLMITPNDSIEVYDFDELEPLLYTEDYDCQNKTSSTSSTSKPKYSEHSFMVTY
ncbi:hypothetical protein [Brumimicrobium glaciale]|uniref:hypothetical protein n=1 Tax=Brumimicrobium glaciale TaxID=200475 RepID=UPI0013EA750C|nr:hypothetical protein [Brumimicrobium glaciale]